MVVCVCGGGGRELKFFPALFCWSVVLTIIGGGGGGGGGGLNL